MNKKTIQSFFKKVLTGVIILLAGKGMFELLNWLLTFKNLLSNPIKLYWLLILGLVSMLLLIFSIVFARKFYKIQKVVDGKTKKCISINNLSSKSKQLLTKHINKTIAMSYGLNENVIEELKNLNIIEPYDKINHKLNYWFFECLSKNPNLLEV